MAERNNKFLLMSPLEWMVCGTIIVILIAILIPSLGRTRHGYSTLSSCAANLKGLGTMMGMYSSQYGDHLPSGSPPFSGTWMNDQPASLFDQILSVPGASASKAILTKLLFCPANLPTDLAARWGGPTATWRSTGYVWLNDRSSLTPAMPDLTTVPARTPPLTYHDKWNGVPFASSTELVLDMIISDKPVPTAKVWTEIKSPTRPGTYSTNHMKSDTAPSGANLLYFDGHVSFRPFTISTTAPPIPVAQNPGNTAPYFWFPKP